MSFHRVLGITAIDPPRTIRKEDGFCVNKPNRGRGLFIASIIPDFDKAYFFRVEEALEKGYVSKEAKAPVYLVPGDNGFSTNEIRRGIVIKMDYPYLKATVLTDDVIIDRELTYEEAEKILETDEELKKIRNYVSRDFPNPPSIQEITDTLIFKFSFACADFMKKAQIPFLGARNRGIFLNSGFCLINKPLRDPIAFINCLQLSTFFETKGGLYFSKEELLEIVAKYGKGKS